MAKVKHVLNVQARTAGTTNDARRLRKTGLIPAIVYGKGIEPKCISVNATEWQLLSRNELNILSLVEDGKETLVLLKEVQHDPGPEDQGARRGPSRPRTARRRLRRRPA